MKNISRQIRIGILTFHRCVNNGAVMQAYSLSKRLMHELGNQNVSVEIIDYQMPRVDQYCKATLRNYYRNCSLPLALKRTYRLLQNPRKFKQDKERAAVFEEAFETLPLSKRRIYDDGCDVLFKYMDETYDIVIAGSDAIWNYDIRGLPNPYFLSDSIHCEKYTYAASVYGLNYENISESDRKEIGRILNSYRLLCTRDDESSKFVTQMGCTSTPIHTCDPTVFLDVNDLPVDQAVIEAKLKKKGFDFQKPTIGMMGTDAMCEMLRKMYGHQYQIVALFNFCKGADVNIHDFSPFEWAYVFRYFKVTVTTFFHGTLLSLRNGVPVVCIALNNAYTRCHKTKVQDVLERVGYAHSYFSTDYRTTSINQIKTQIDDYMANDLHDEIIVRMDEEATSFTSFIEQLKKNIEAMREEQR